MSSSGTYKNVWGQDVKSLTPRCEKKATKYKLIRCLLPKYDIILTSLIVQFSIHKSPIKLNNIYNLDLLIL